MGCWNGTCAVSNLHIRAGQDVAVFMLLENRNKKTFCYNNALYDVCPIPFYGKYDDYGGVDECRGIGLDIILHELKAKLYEFGQGPNSCHDVPVKKEKFDMDLMFEADHEDRLGIEYYDRWDSDKYDLSELRRQESADGLSPDQQFELDRLAGILKKEDNFRRVTHVIVHGDVLKAIKEKWYVEEYVGQNEGNVGYNNSYRHTYFKDLIAGIPEYIRVEKEFVEKMKNGPKSGKAMLGHRFRVFSRSEQNLVHQWLRSATDIGSQNGFGLVDVGEYISAYIEIENFNGLAEFIEEVLVGIWVNTFMVSTRKVWTQQCGMGSQSQESLGYEVLSNTVLDILKEEKRECDGEFDDEIED